MWQAVYSLYSPLCEREKEKSNSAYNNLYHVDVHCGNQINPIERLVAVSKQLKVKIF